MLTFDPERQIYSVVQTKGAKAKHLAARRSSMPHIQENYSVLTQRRINEIE